MHLIRRCYQFSGRRTGEGLDTPELGVYSVRLMQVPNIDLLWGQGTGTGFWGEIPPREPRWVPVGVRGQPLEEVLELARAEVQAWIARWELGGGNWTGGAVADPDGKIVAHINYSGGLRGTDFMPAGGPAALLAQYRKTEAEAWTLAAPPGWRA